MARARKEKKLTQAELAQNVGASQRTIAAIEGGTRRPSPELAQRIGTELEFPWTVFFDQAGQDEEKSVNVDAFEGIRKAGTGRCG